MHAMTSLTANLRMEIYRKIAASEDAEREILAELADRFGPPPAAVQTLIEPVSQPAPQPAVEAPVAIEAPVIPASAPVVPQLPTRFDAPVETASYVSISETVRRAAEGARKANGRSKSRRIVDARRCVAPKALTSPVKERRGRASPSPRFLLSRTGQSLTSRGADSITH